jgi:hypothetical protein
MENKINQLNDPNKSTINEIKKKINEHEEQKQNILQFLQENERKKKLDQSCI